LIRNFIAFQGFGIIRLNVDRGLVGKRYAGTVLDLLIIIDPLANELVLNSLVEPDFKGIS